MHACTYIYYALLYIDDLVGCWIEDHFENLLSDIMLKARFVN